MCSFSLSQLKVIRQPGFSLHQADPLPNNLVVVLLHTEDVVGPQTSSSTCEERKRQSRCDIWSHHHLTVNISAVTAMTAHNKSFMSIAEGIKCLIIQTQLEDKPALFLCTIESGRFTQIAKTSFHIHLCRIDSCS